MAGQGGGGIFADRRREPAIEDSRGKATGTLGGWSAKFRINANFILFLEKRKFYSLTRRKLSGNENSSANGAYE